MLQAAVWDAGDVVFTDFPRKRWVQWGLPIRGRIPGSVMQEISIFCEDSKLGLLC